MFRRLLMLCSLALPIALQANPLTLEGDYQTTAGGVNYQVSPNPISWAAFYDLSTSSLPIGSFSMAASLSGAHELVTGSIQTPSNLTVTSSSSTGFTVSAEDYNPYTTSKEMLSIGDIVISGLEGDGVTPFVTKDRSRFFLMMHAGPIERLYCHEIATNQTCPGYPKTLPFDDGYAFTTDREYAYFDSDTGKLYFSAVKQSTPPLKGITCWDTVNEASCGSVALEDENNAYTSRPLVVGEKVYAMSHGSLYCFNDDLSTECPGYPVLIAEPPLLYRDFGAITHNNKLYFVVQNSILCWDPQTDTACSEWPTPLIEFYHVASNDNRLYLGFDTNATPDKICHVGFKNCVTFLNGEVTTTDAHSYAGNGHIAHYTNTLGQAVSVFGAGALIFYNWSTNENVYLGPSGGTHYSSYLDSAGCLWFGGHHLNLSLELRLDTNVVGAVPTNSLLLEGCRNGVFQGSCHWLLVN